MCFWPHKIFGGLYKAYFSEIRAENRRENQNIGTFNRPDTIIYSLKLQFIIFPYQFW